MDSLEPTPPVENPPEGESKPSKPKSQRNRFTNFMKRAALVDLLAEINVENQKIKCSTKNKAEYDRQWAILKERWIPKIELRESEYRQAAAQRGVQKGEKFRSLMNKVPLDKKASRDEIAIWILNHLGSKPHQVDVEEIPCRGAVLYLVEAADDAKFRRELMRIFLSDKRQQKAEEHEDEHDRSLIDLASTMEECLAPQGATGSQSEPAVPGELVGEGEPG